MPTPIPPFLLQTPDNPDGLPATPVNLASLSRMRNRTEPVQAAKAMTTLLAC